MIEEYMKSKKLVNKISFGLVTTGVDLLLFSVALGLNLFASSRKGKDPIRLLSEAAEMTDRFKKEYLVRTSYYARKKGWLEAGKNKAVLSKSGLEQIKGKIPVYRKNRFWSGRVYLITYDISENQKALRNNFRKKLKDNKLMMIQQSVWLSIYKPNWLVEPYIDKLDDQGMILVSSLRKGEGVGGEDLDRLVEKLYQLEEINKRYYQFCEQVKSDKFSKNDIQLLKCFYLSILKDDPQLPRGLMPEGWYGDYAYKLYTKL